MAEQETLIDSRASGPFNPEDEGLWKRFIEDDGMHINVGRWNRAVEDRSYVGTCRHCGGYLRPLRPDKPAPGDDVSAVTEWFVAICVTGRDEHSQPAGAGCRHEFVAPDGKVLQRSARQSRMPRTFLRSRAGVIDKPRADP